MIPRCVLPTPAQGQQLHVTNLALVMGPSQCKYRVKVADESALMGAYKRCIVRAVSHDELFTEVVKIWC